MTGKITEGIAEEGERRRRRTDAYCRMWLVPLIEGGAPVVTTAEVIIGAPTAVRGRALAYVCGALKANGLSQAEVFAMADAFGLWDALTPIEHDFVLNPAPESHEVIQAAWRYEAADVLLWALGQRRHLPFPDVVTDPAKVTASAITTAQTTASLRVEKELLDAADIAWRLRLLCLAADAPPAALNAGVVHERAAAFDWLLGRAPA